MTLTQVHPFWYAGDVLPADIPYIACNDMLAGNMSEEIVAVACIPQSDLSGVDHYLPKAFAALGLESMTEEEAAKIVVMDRMRDVAERLITGAIDPCRGADQIYYFAMEAGIFRDDDVPEQVTAYGWGFLQMQDALEVRQDNAVLKRLFEELIIEAAAALLAGERVPEWHSDKYGNLIRGRAPWAKPAST